jgi:hypothetical protein
MNANGTLVPDNDLSSIFNPVQHGEQDQFHYVLLDPTGLPELPALLRRNPRATSNLFRLEGQHSAEAVSPLLLPWQASPGSGTWREFEHWIVEAACTSASVLWLSSPLSQEVLARRLAQRVDAVLPDELEVVLRFFDTRVFAALLQCLPPSVRARFLAPATQWVFVGRRGEIRRIASEFAADDMLGLPLRLDASTEAALIEASEPDQIADMLGKTVPYAYLGLPFEERYDFIVRQRQRAHELAIDSSVDVALFCALALQHGEDFAQHEPWRSRLEQRMRERSSLADVIVSMENDVLASLSTNP